MTDIMELGEFLNEVGLTMSVYPTTGLKGNHCWEAVVECPLGCKVNLVTKGGKGIPASRGYEKYQVLRGLAIKLSGKTLRVTGLVVRDIYVPELWSD